MVAVHLAKVLVRALAEEAREDRSIPSHQHALLHNSDTCGVRRNTPCRGRPYHSHHMALDRTGTPPGTPPSSLRRSRSFSKLMSLRLTLAT